MPKGVYKKTEEHKRKLSEANIGKHFSIKTEFQKGDNIGNKNAWKGGMKCDGYGYLQIMVPKGCRFSCMGDNKGYIRLHRLLMAEYLQRPLYPEEVVHHINGNITDNQIENLKLLENKSKHTSLHRKLRKLKGGNI